MWEKADTKKTCYCRVTRVNCHHHLSCSSPPKWPILCRVGR